jgi:hypothetical protein
MLLAWTLCAVEQHQIRVLLKTEAGFNHQSWKRAEAAGCIRRECLVPHCMLQTAISGCLCMRQSSLPVFASTWALLMLEDDVAAEPVESWSNDVSVL